MKLRQLQTSKEYWISSEILQFTQETENGHLEAEKYGFLVYKIQQIFKWYPDYHCDNSQ